MSKIPRLSQLPQPKGWLPIAVVSTILAIVCGLAGTNSGFLDAQYKVNLWLNQSGNDFTTSLSKYGSLMFSPKQAIILTLVVMAVIWFIGRSPFGAIEFGSMVAFGWLPAEVFKLLFNEPRGNVALLTNQVLPLETDTSFPSGHVCFAIAFGFAVYQFARGTRFQTLVTILWPVLVVFEAWARLYAGAHYLNDVFGSIFTTIVGALVLIAVWDNQLSPRLQKIKLFQK